MIDSSIADDALLTAAIAAREHAYAPYSHYQVGAALLTRDGKIYGGCNVENQAYPSGICAERVAVGKAISDGQQWADFVAIAVVGTGDSPCRPCGMCRQLLSEMYARAAKQGDGKAGDLRVIMINSPKTREKKLVKTLRELLPYWFEL
ncbi:MAG: cytidine deaminase [Chloroflexia bacterium]